MLHALDDLEDHPKYYERIKEDVIMDDSYSNLTVFKSCWIYFLKKYKPTLLKLPFLDDYSSYGSHGLEYVVRYNRLPLHQYCSMTDVQGII